MPEAWLKETNKCEDVDWCTQRSGEKCTDGKMEVQGGQLHTMFASTSGSSLGADISELGGGYEFT